MATAKDYPVYFPYGATSDPYSTTHPHRGEDRCNKLGVPVVIGSTTIGLVGATGKVYDSQGNKGTPAAAHLHIQEWSGSYANTRKPRNEFKGGKVINVDLNGTQGDGSFGKFISIQTSDGWVDTYCHLSKINVSVGQVIGTTTTGGTTVKFQNIEQVKLAYLMMRGKLGTTAEMQAWVGQDVERFFKLGKGETDATRTALAAAKKQVTSLTSQVEALKKQVAAGSTGGQFVPVGDLYVKKG